MLNETPKGKVFRSTTKISETLQRYGKGLKKDKGIFKKITPAESRVIKKATSRVIKDYSPLLKKLGKE